MGSFGFSYAGLGYLLMLTIPNIIWSRKQPPGYDAAGESKVLLIMERAGQVLVTCCALVFDDFNVKPFTPWSIWLIVSFVMMLLYELFWIRYFKNPTLESFYGSFRGVPVPGASLPIAAFFLLGVYGRVWWMLVSVAILGIGHIGIHLQHLRRLRRAGGAP